MSVTLAEDEMKRDMRERKCYGYGDESLRHIVVITQRQT